MCESDSLVFLVFNSIKKKYEVHTVKVMLYAAKSWWWYVYLVFRFCWLEHMFQRIWINFNYTNIDRLQKLLMQKPHWRRHENSRMKEWESQKLDLKTAFTRWRNSNIVANEKFTIRANRTYHKSKKRKDDDEEEEKNTHTKFNVVRQWGGTGLHVFFFRVCA